MKPIKYLFMTACLLILAACVGGGGAKSPVNDDTRVTASTVVGQDGTLSFTGTGEMAGITLNATVPALAGKTVFIEKTDAGYKVDGYIAVSPKFTLELADDDEGVYPAAAALTYTTDTLQTGITADDIALCSIAGNSVTKLATSNGAGDTVTASVVIPGSYFAAYKQIYSEAPAKGIIKFAGVSYKTALLENLIFTDPSAKITADTSRGIDHVQPGERVMLDINSEALGEAVSTYHWTLSAKPAGSLAVLTLTGTEAQFIPDQLGKYTVSLTAEGVGGKTVTETKDITVLNYSYAAFTDSAMCYTICHDGNYDTGAKDKYGRNIMRDMVGIWSTSAHANAFAAVSGTDSRCYQCNATGFLFADRDHNNSDDHPEAAGYDDKITNWTTLAASANHLQNVTCEACHGPAMGGPEGFLASHFTATPKTSEVCLSCHDHGDMNGHFFEYSDAHDKSFTLAGGNVAKNAQCFKCHTGEGMMARIFNVTETPETAETFTGVSCTVCHDPHGEGGNNAQLRISGNYTITTSAGTYTAQAGDSLICYNCHNADITLPAVGTIPHNSQAEMLKGVGGYTYGTAMNPVVSDHSAQNLTCADCHMKKGQGTTHQMLMTSGPADRIDGCTDTCHTTAPAYSNGHFDYQGRMAALRAKIDQLQELINTKSGMAAGSAVKASYTADTQAKTDALNRAAYNFNFILSDKSSGFHNPDYTDTLIQMSLNDLANY